MYARTRFLLVLLLAAATPAFAGAQNSSARSVAGPRIDAIATGIRLSEQRADSGAPAQRRRQSMGQPIALMVVGGAAFVLGALIGGDIGLLFMIGGAAALLIGLYRYMR